MRLNPRQQEAVEHENGPLLIIAGAGSGKTKTLTSRLATLIEKGVPPEHILAITFTNKAAKEMVDRLSHIPRKKVYTSFGEAPFIGTFHSFGARLLRQEAHALSRKKGFTIFDTDDSMRAMRKIMKGQTWMRGEWSPINVFREIGRVKSLLLNPNEVLDEKTHDVYEVYENFLRENNAFDFDDLIEKPVFLFKKFPDIREQYNHQFTHILVDEYQDVNTAQYTLIKYLAGSRGNVCVVGDDAQAIYGWRYADFKNFLNFEKEWEKTRVVKLEQNYRSTSNIITAASHVIKHNKIQKPKDLWTENDAGDPIQVIATRGSQEEADIISEKILERYRKEKNSEIAILYRTNAQSRALEQALIQERIPYRIFGGVKFYERKEIKDIVSGLRVIANPQDQISADRLLTNLKKSIARPLLETLSQANKLPPLELIQLFLQKSNYFEYLNQKFPNANERIENIKELTAFASSFNGVDEFLEAITLLQATDEPNSDASKKRVNLMTIHLSKGLEFDHVYLAGVSEGLLPHQMSYGSMEELEEERRLMYVAMTRAKKSLSVSFSKLPSRFLYEIPPELTEFTHLGGAYQELPDDDIYVDYL